MHAQSFCNGRVGTGGISYDGIAGALMAAQGNIDAAALLFAPGDIYEDIAVPGGVPCSGFVDMYGTFTTASENNEPVVDVDNELPAAYVGGSIGWGGGLDDCQPRPTGSTDHHKHHEALGPSPHPSSASVQPRRSCVPANLPPQPTL